MLYNTKEEEAAAYVARFKWMFRRKFGCTPLVKYKVGLRHFNSITLKELLYIINIKLNEKSPEHLPNGIATKCRYRYIVEYRQMYFKIAKEMGFGVIDIGQSIGYNHATVIHGANNVKNLLATNNKDMVRLNNEIEKAIYEFLNHESIVENDFINIKENTDEVFV